MNTPLVGIIVLSWNHKGDALECLNSLQEINYPNYRVILVDNASTDDTVDAVRAQFPAVEVIVNDCNLGYAGGNNVGIKYALDSGIEAILLLNDDTIVDPSFVTILTDALYRSPDIGAVNPTIYYYDEPNTIWSAGGSVDISTGIAHQRRVDEVDDGRPLPECDVEYGVGAAILIKREAMEKTGPLDPDFFVYYEESDWCFRAKEAGFRTIYVPSAKIWHKVSRSMVGNRSTLDYYYCRNRLLFLKKRGMGKIKLFKIATLDFGRMSASSALRGRFWQSRLVARGVLDFYRGRVGKVNL